MVSVRATAAVKRAGLATIRLRREIEQFADEQGVEFSAAHAAVMECVPLIGDPDFNVKTRAIASAREIDWQPLVDLLIAKLMAWLESCEV